MFHNSGAYGPNGTPNNMGVPINRTLLPGQNTHHGLNNMNKLTQQPSQAAGVHHNVPHFANYTHPPVNPVFQTTMFDNYNPMAYQSYYQSQNASSIQEHWQNSMLPMNLNMNHVGGSHLGVDSRLESNISTDIRDQTTHRRNTLLNIPQVQKRPPITNTDDVCTYNNVIKSSNLDLSSRNSILLDEDRRRSLENTVKLIENILIKSTTNQTEEPEHLDNDPLIMPPAETAVEEQSVEESSKHSDDGDEEENHVDSEAELDSAEEDVKPDISELVLDDVRTGIVSKVMVKVEQTSWTDTEYSAPFDKDVHGVQRSEVTDNDVVDSETAIERATEDMKSEAETSVYYECGLCSLVFGHPKRYLIHTKWHQFGQKAKTKLERAKEREMIRNQQREAKVMERMEANEVREITGNQPVYPCKDCTKMFASKNSLKNHRQRHHPTLARECRICHKSVSSWAGLRRHLATHTAEGAGVFQCADCPKQFKYAQSLAKHRDTHLEKTQCCPQCPKKFGSAALLKMHSKTHERQMRGATYHCSYCGKGFYEAYNMQVHERTHRNERPFTCDICNSNFGTNSSLKRHLRVSHSSSKPFECATCHRSFVTAAIRDRHHRRVHSDLTDFKFTCDHCPRRYMKSKDLQKHIYKVHPTVKRRKKTNSDSE